MAGRARIPTEHTEQVALFRWIAYARHGHPELHNCFSIPNGGARTAVTGARLRDEGVRPGVPDLFLAYPGAGGYLGLFIELKRAHGGRVSPEQQEWITRLQGAGYCVMVCHGWIEARDAICDYVGIPHD